MQIKQPQILWASSSLTPSRFPWIFSLIVSAIVLIGSVLLGAYNFYLDKKIASTQQELQVLDTQIQTASEDRKVIIAQILSANTIRPSLDINGLVKEFQRAAVVANVRLKWFSVMNDTISTTLIATEWDPQVHPDPAATIIKMMREYARGQQYFSLEPILSISGDMKSRTTSIQFKVVGKTY